uniref:Transmembrane protein 115 n=1 Tax=Haemonchus contortus TaxID=6289 RepID=A0A7I4YRE4_HAECO
MKGVLGDLQIVVDQHSDVLRNNALPFRVLIAIRTLGLVISPIAVAYESVALLPFQLFTIEVWRLITCHFVGPNILLYAWTVWSLHFGTNLRRQNNCNESLLIYAITQILTVLIVCGAAYGLYAVAAKTSLLYETYIVDMVPLNCAVLVLIKQFLPDTILLETPFGRIKYTHLPIMAILLISLLYLVGIVRPVTILQGLLAVQISWTYLRFFNAQDSEGTCGDSSEHFVWASLFPRATQPFFTVLGRICFRSLVKLGVCKRTIRHVDLQSVGISLRGLDSKARDAERRRQKALRDLNERLSKTKKLETIAWDEDAEDENSAPGISSKHSENKADEEEIVVEPSTTAQSSERAESRA